MLVIVILYAILLLLLFSCYGFVFENSSNNVYQYKVTYILLLTYFIQ